MNITVSPSLRSLAVQKAAQPFVNEQHVCVPYVLVDVFTVHGDKGPLRVYNLPLKRSAPTRRQYAVGTSCAHPSHLLRTLPKPRSKLPLEPSGLVNVPKTPKMP